MLTPSLHKRWVLALMATAISGCVTLRGEGFGGFSEDAKITANVRASLSSCAALGHANRLIVQTRDRVVYLKGTVSTELQRRNAELLAIQAERVDLVVNTLGVADL
jgi:osmotically-inducible protein OsmY